MDFKLAYMVQEAVNSQFQFIHLALNDKRIQKYPIIFTTKNEVAKISVYQDLFVLNPDTPILGIKMEIIKGLSENGYDECIFGIDPGLSIGLSAIYRNEVIDTNLVYSKEKVITWIKNIYQFLNCKGQRIRLGKGGGHYMHELLDQLEKNFPTTQIELIDEKSTSIKIKKDLSIHEQAAIQIARRFNP